MKIGRWLSVLGFVGASSFGAPVPEVKDRPALEVRVIYGSSSGSGQTRGAAYSEAQVRVPVGGHVYKRVTWGAHSNWTTVLYWKIQR